MSGADIHRANRQDGLNDPAGTLLIYRKNGPRIVRIPENAFCIHSVVMLRQEVRVVLEL
jgi:hypothetical protein